MEDGRRTAQLDRLYERDLSDFSSELNYRAIETIHKKNLTKNDSQNSTKPQELIQLFLKISNSFYLLISRLVNHYQPFTIDELLDSINRDKIDYLKPLDLNLEMADGVKKLKNILKDFENKTSEDHKNDNINELKNQFKNQLIKAGKTLIALFLLRSEKIELFTDFDAKIWYRHLRNLIISGKSEQEITKNIENITIISFNYDRGLDYYLRTRLSNYYEKIQKRIYYPYGTLSHNTTSWTICVHFFSFKYTYSTFSASKMLHKKSGFIPPHLLLRPCSP